jgi:hypothetical protein
LLASTLALLQSCGGSSLSSPSPTPALPPGPIAIAEVNQALSAGQVYPNPILTPRLGTLELVLQWGHATNGMMVGIAVSPCTVEAFQNYNCNFVAEDRLASTSPTKTLTVASLAAGTYVVIVYNWGPGAESYSYTVTLTPTS